jgi:hypothetical protein
MRITKILILSFSLVMFTLATYADEFNPLVYQYHDPDVTVEFAEPLNISEERHQQIADTIAGNNSSSASGPSPSLPDNIICTLFGHDLSTTTVTATHHKAKPHEPRCLMEVYHVTACSRCNYTDPELVGSVFIVCCPED